MQQKTCLVCKKKLPLTEFYMFKSKYKDKTYIYPRHLCKKCLNNETDKWRKENKERWLGLSRKRRSSLKIKLLKEMGGKCTCCGCIDYWNLTFDHIKPIRRKNGERSDLVPILSKNKKLRKGFQILCYGCNNSKNSNKKCLINHDLQIGVELE